MKLPRLSRTRAFMIGTLYLVLFLWCFFIVDLEEPNTSSYASTLELNTTIQASSGVLTTTSPLSFLPLVLADRSWADCSQSSFGTMLVNVDPDDWITPDSVLIYANDQLGIKGLTGTGAPSDYVRDNWYSRLPGWTRSFMRGTYDTLQNIHWAATVFGMEDMYECFAYGPESAHQAGEEALDPVYWVPRAETLAEDVGKCLIYAPAVRDYELLATPEGESEPRDDLIADLIAQVAPHVDIWMVQLGKYQPWVDRGQDDDGNPYTMDDFRNWIAQWVSWIKTANPSIRVWTQLGIGQVDPIQQVCLPSQPPEYILDFRETLISAGVDGVWVMPAQPCMPCPPSPPPGFICSTDPQDNEYYRQSLSSFQQAMEIACTATHDIYLPLVHKSRHWTGCSISRLGSVLITMQEFDDSTGPELVSLAEDGITGLAGSTTYYTALEYFPSLVGWDKAHLCNSLECLVTRVSNSARDALEFGYLVYDPERLPGVPDEEKYNLPWATAQARQIADEAGKQLMISYGTTQLHQEAEERGFGWENAGQVVDLLAPYGDAWLIQAADEYNNPYTNPDHPDPILSQRHFPPGPEWRAEVERWTNWVRTANPDIDIWIQLALHRIPAGEPPWEDNYPSAELVLEYREWLVNPAYGPPLVDGVYLTSIYSWAIDSVVADQEMERAIRWACESEVAQEGISISLVEEGWTDNLVIEGITLLPGFYYRVFENSRYPCGAEGNHQFMVLDNGTDASAPKHLFAKFLGGGMGFWYYNSDGDRLYYPQPNAVGLLNATLNRNWMFRSSVSQEFANGVTKRFRENSGFRIMVPSYCSHDFYHSTGQCDETDGFCRYGYLAAMEAVDYVQQHFNTGSIIVYGGSAGAAGFFVGQDQDNVVGIIMDSQAIDLAAIRDACYGGINVFGSGGAYPCFCPEGGSTCMEILAQRIGFHLDEDEPYHVVERGEVDRPIFLVWNYHDASRYAHYQYDNLHNAIRQYNPGGNSVACRVCLPNADPDIPNNCIDDDSHVPIGSCNLHVPSAYDYDYTTELADDIYAWSLSLVGDFAGHAAYLPMLLK